MESNVDFTQYLDQHSGQVTHDEQLLYMMKTEPSSPPKWDWRKKTVKSRIIAQQNTALIHYVCVNLSVCHSRDISAFLHCVRFSTIQIIYFLKVNDTRTSKTMFQGVWRANTQIQIHIYTNTASVKVADRPNMCYIFEKVMVQGPQKRCSRVSHMQTQKQNFTNTPIQFG